MTRDSVRQSRCNFNYCSTRAASISEATRRNVEMEVVIKWQAQRYLMVLAAESDSRKLDRTATSSRTHRAASRWATTVRLLVSRLNGWGVVLVAATR
jgi:hypothetical protein